MSKDIRLIQWADRIVNRLGNDRWRKVHPLALNRIKGVVAVQRECDGKWINVAVMHECMTRFLVYSTLTETPWFPTPEAAVAYWEMTRG